MMLSQDNTGNVDFSDIRESLTGLIRNLKSMDVETEGERLFKRLRKEDCEY